MAMSKSNWITIKMNKIHLTSDGGVMILRYSVVLWACT